MLWTIGLLSVAIVGAGTPFHHRAWTQLTPGQKEIAGAFYYLSPMFLAMGLAAPFRRKALGAVIGVLGAISIFVAYLTLMGWGRF